MSKALKAAALGAAIGFATALLLLILKVRSPLVRLTFWPTSALSTATRGSGDIWNLVFEVVGFFANAVLYGLIGFGIGRLMYPREDRP